MGRTIWVVMARFALATLAAGTANADVADYTVQTLAFEGNFDPEFGTLSIFTGTTDLDENRRVTFLSYLSGGTTSHRTGIFQVESGTLELLIGDGDVAPETGGLLFNDLAWPRVAASKILGYAGGYGSGGSDVGVFLRNGESDSAFALTGDSGPRWRGDHSDRTGSQCHRIGVGRVWGVDRHRWSESDCRADGVRDDGLARDLPRRPTRTGRCRRNL